MQDLKGRFAVVPRNSPNFAVAEHEVALLTPCEDIGAVRLIVCGHSQAWAINRAIVTDARIGDSAAGIDIAAALRIGALPGNVKLGPTYWEIAAELASTRELAVVWNGNQVNAFFMFALPPFDFVPRTELDCELIDGLELVSEAAVRENFLPSLVKLQELLDKVGRPEGCRRYVFGTPPPLYDAELIRSRLLREPHFVELAKKMGVGIATVPIMPWQVRRKLWLVLQELMQELAMQQGAIFIPCPPDMLDERGCLAVHHAAGDASHCGLSFGVAQLRELAAHMREFA